MLHCDLFENLHDLWKKRVGYLRNDQTENPASSGNQSARLRVGIIAKLINNAPYTFCELWVYRRNPVDGARHRCSRYACALCDFPDIHEEDSVAGSSKKIIAKLDNAL